MKLVDLSVRDFVREVDSASPAPGGGSVSAVSASMGLALMRMVGHLTIPKKKFAKLDESVQRAFVDIHESLKGLQSKMLELVDKDTEAFNAIMDAFRMPKETESEQKKRNKVIEQATMKAIETPEAMADIAYIALKKADFIAKYGNKNALSDVGVSTLMLYAGLEGACLNVLINLPGISDLAQRKAYQEKVLKLMKEANDIKDQTLETIHAALVD